MKYSDEDEIRFSRILCDENDFLITRYLSRKPKGLRPSLMKQYRDLLCEPRTDLMRNFEWCHGEGSLDSVLGIGQGNPIRRSEVRRLGGPSKNAIALRY